MDQEKLFNVDASQLINRLSTILKTGQGYGPEFKPTIKQAIQLLKRVKANRANSHTYFTLGELFLQLQDTAFAIEAFKTAWTLEPANVNAGTYYALLLEQTGALDQAIAIYLLLNKIQPENLELVNQILELAFQQRDINLLVDTCNTLLTRGAYASVYYYLTRALNLSGNHKDALKQISKAVELEPDNSLYLQRLIHLLYKCEDYATLTNYAEYLLSDSDIDIEYRVLLANSYIKTGQIQRGRDTFVRCLKLSKNQNERLEVLTEIALYYCYEERNLNKARFWNQYVLHKNPTHSKALNNHGVFSDNWQKMVNSYEESLRHDPDNPQTRSNLGLALFRTKDMERGFELYESRVDVDMPHLKPYLRYPESIAGKKLFAWDEQGIGDMYIWSGLFSFLQRDGVQATIQVDPRLLSLMQRSFPDLSFTAEETSEILRQENLSNYDAVVMFMSIARYYFNDIRAANDLHDMGNPKAPHLMASESRISEIKEMLAEFSDKKVVGLCWRSSVTKFLRDQYYMTIADVIELFEGLDCYILNLQYNTTDDDLIELSNAFGNRFIHLQGIDLKDDQESVAAMIMACDFVVSVPTAVSALCGSLGQRLLATAGVGIVGKPTHPFMANATGIYNTGIVHEDLHYIKECIAEEIASN